MPFKFSSFLFSWNVSCTGLHTWWILLFQRFDDFDAARNLTNSNSQLSYAVGRVPTSELRTCSSLQLNLIFYHKSARAFVCSACRLIKTSLLRFAPLSIICRSLCISSRGLWMNDLDAGHVSTAVASILIEEVFGYHTINRSSGGQGHQGTMKTYEDYHSWYSCRACHSYLWRFHRSYLLFRWIWVYNFQNFPAETPRPSVASLKLLKLLRHGTTSKHQQYSAITKDIIRQYWKIIEPLYIIIYIYVYTYIYIHRTPLSLSLYIYIYIYIPIKSILIIFASPCVSQQLQEDHRRPTEQLLVV